MGKPMAEIRAETPGKGELEQMLRRIAPEIARVFRDYGASEEEARRLLGETLAAFSRKWGRILNRERWLLRNLEKAVREAWNGREG
jgi:hypothetical protein